MSEPVTAFRGRELAIPARACAFLRSACVCVHTIAEMLNAVTAGPPMAMDAGGAAGPDFVRELSVGHA
jgi:hypothetical protein